MRGMTSSASTPGRASEQPSEPPEETTQQVPASAREAAAEQPNRDDWPVNPAHAAGPASAAPAGPASATPAGPASAAPAGPASATPPGPASAAPAGPASATPPGGGWVWTGPPPADTTATQPGAPPQPAAPPPPVAPPGYVMVPAGTAYPPAPAGRGHSGLRWTGAVVLLILAALLLGTSVMVRFARSEIIDTNRYVDTVAPLASDPAVQTAVADRVTQEIMGRIDVTDLLRKAAAATNLGNDEAIVNLLSGPLSSSVTGFVHQRVLDFVRSDQFRTLWITANREAHTQVSGLLTGEGTQVLKSQGNQIILQLGPVVAEVKKRLVADGFTLANQIPDVKAQFTVYSAEKLPAIQGWVRTLERLAFWLPILALILLVGGIALAPDRRRAALIGFFLTGIVAVLLLVAINVGRNVYSSDVSSRNLNVPAALAIYDAVMRYLIIALRALVVVCVVAVLWLWLAGPGRAGRGVRAVGARGEDLIAGQLGKLHWHPLELVGAFLSRWRTPVVVVIGALVSWAFLAGPTVASAIWLSLLMVVVLVVIGSLARLAPRQATPA
jgi:hypothetical protein